MISLEHVSKVQQTGGRLRCLIDDVSFVFERGRSVAILGEDAEARSILLSLMSGKLRPSSGRVRRKGRFFSGLPKMQGTLTGVENAKFACRIYGMELQAVMDYVVRFTKLGNALDAPVITYPPEMRTRFAVALNLGLRFDAYLLDPLSSATDARFLRAAAEEFEGRAGAPDMILVSGSQKAMRRFCTHAVTLQNGKLGELEPIETALANLQTS